jgi:hypothetical protein
MGQEIASTHFSPEDFERFLQRLNQETELLDERIQSGVCSVRAPTGGLELEAWLVDESMRPVPRNAEFLAVFDHPCASPELAKFNVEFNHPPFRLQGNAFSSLHTRLECLWKEACETATGLGVHLLAIGILPTLRENDLGLEQLSSLNRYEALNEQIFLARRQRPIRLDIVGREHLHGERQDVMLEAATTSFQLHLQVPSDKVVAYYNGAQLASAPSVGISGNSPFLFGHNLWTETRIPLFEQSVDAGGYQDAARGPLHRVGFGTDYVRRSMIEVFRENATHFPVLLPTLFPDAPEALSHLRLHNGTIWRWNRPLVGFDEDGTLHLRVEHRVIPAGPTIADMVANAVFFFGLVEGLVTEMNVERVPFASARDNFYDAARLGLAAHAVWFGGERWRMRRLILKHLLPLAERGLSQLGIDPQDAGHYLGIIEARAASGQTGSVWQRSFMARHPQDFAPMMRSYLDLQREGEPVHLWPL